jgi:hypothetical protein
MIDEQDTTKTETTNSEGTTTNDQSSDQDTSDTKSQQKSDDGEEHVDLGTDKGDEDKTDDDQDQDKDERTDEEKAADEERAKLFGAPEGDAPYEITGLPEGMDIDKEALAAITPVARKLDLSNDGMSAIAQVYATDVLPGVAQRVVEGLNADALDKRKEWEGEARDLIAGKGEPLKTLSGDKIDFGGRSLKEVQALAAKTLDKVAPAGFREWLDETGLGVHPQMIALAFSIGKDLVAEDRELEHADHADHGERGKGDANRKTGGLSPSKFYDRS